MTHICKPTFAPGQIVRHKVNGYRGLIFDVDACFSEEPSWLEKLNADERSTKKPWYHVLVDGQTHTTYVAEDSLELATGADCSIEFDHPLLGDFFRKEDAGSLSARHSLN